MERGDVNINQGRVNEIPAHSAAKALSTNCWSDQNSDSMVAAMQHKSDGLLQKAMESRSIQQIVQCLEVHHCHASVEIVSRARNLRNLLRKDEKKARRLLRHPLAELGQGASLALDELEQQLGVKVRVGLDGIK